MKLIFIVCHDFLTNQSYIVIVIEKFDIDWFIWQRC